MPHKNEITFLIKHKFYNNNNNNNNNKKKSVEFYFKKKQKNYPLRKKINLL